jgi:hypothetical protein
MKYIKILALLVLILPLFISCGDDDEIDEEVPEIDLSIDGAFPTNCDTLYFGETFTMKVLFSDNVELGSCDAYSIDIHNNFDHHSHTTEVVECNLDDIKDAVNAYVSITSYDIPEGVSEYETDLEITLPSTDSDGNTYDTGDYHFFFSISDKEGWTTQKGLSLKILYR